MIAAAAAPTAALAAPATQKDKKLVQDKPLPSSIPTTTMTTTTMTTKTSKPRSSIRQSLNLSSMGKALADVMSKDSRDADKAAKKARAGEDRDHRLSVLNSKTQRPSIDGSAHTLTVSSVTQRTPTPDAAAVKMAARGARSRRSSVMSRPSVLSDEMSTINGNLTAHQPPAQSAIGHVVTRSASLRPSTRSQTKAVANAAPPAGGGAPPPLAASAGSSLPKYRPKSITVELVKKPPAASPPSSPVRSSTRRRVSTTDDEKDDINVEKGKPRLSSKIMPTAHSPSSATKTIRAISPVPRRGAIKVNLTSAITLTPTKPSPNRRSPSPQKDTPTRANKVARRATVTFPTGANIPRPHSSSGSSSPCTPKTPASAKTVLRSGGRENQSQVSTPTRATLRSPSESPTSSKHSRKGAPPAPARPQTPTPVLRKTKPITSPIQEENSEDDVILLLAPNASLTAPTPVMPRSNRTHKRNPSAPQTPTQQSSTLPGRNNMSYLSPPAPSSTLRPPAERGSGPRGSILSWEELATESSQTLADDELDKLLADIPAPFAPGQNSPFPSAPHSPMPTLRDMPESPLLSAMSSPGAYGSISQVLLPDVTPSPAVHLSVQRRYQHAASEPIPAVDAAIVTLLRLQLAAAENLAQDRLERLTTLEEEIHKQKETRVRETEDLGRQVSALEERLRGNLVVRERNEEEKASYVLSLEDQLRHAHSSHEEAMRRAEQTFRSSHEATLRSRRREWETACVAKAAAMAWHSARELAESELELVRSNKQMLSVLMTGLNGALCVH